MGRSPLAGFISASVLALALAFLTATARVALAAGATVSIGDVNTDNFPEVAVRFTAVDAQGMSLPDLTPDRVQVIHNGQNVPEPRLESVSTAQEGLAVVLAVDTSGSMRGQPLVDAQNAARALVTKMADNDRVAILAFDQRVRLVQEFTGDRGALNAAIDRLDVGADTRLYDAIGEASRSIANQPLGRRAMIVISDGEDTKSNASLDDAVSRAKEARVPVFIIGFGEVMADPMRRIADETGGRYGEAPDSSALTNAVGAIAESLRRFYLLKYFAPDGRPTDNDIVVLVKVGDEEARDDGKFNAPPMPPLEIELASPAAGSTVRDQVELKPTLKNAGRPDEVEYLLDGQTLHRTSAPPFDFTWDSKQTSPGEHELAIRARVGDRQAQKQLKVTVAPPIQVTIKAPDGNLSGSVTLQADVEAGSPVVSVDWSVDGQSIGQATAAPFSVAWDTSKNGAGEHRLSAEAKDQRGNVARAERTVRVAAPGAQPSGTSGATPSATSSANATATPEGEKSAREEFEEKLKGREGAIGLGILLLLIVLIVVFVLLRRGKRRGGMPARPPGAFPGPGAQYTPHPQQFTPPPPTGLGGADATILPPGPATQQVSAFPQSPGPVQGPTTAQGPSTQGGAQNPGFATQSFDPPTPEGLPLDRGTVVGDPGTYPGQPSTVPGDPTTQQGTVVPREPQTLHSTSQPGVWDSGATQFGGQTLSPGADRPHDTSTGAVLGATHTGPDGPPTPMFGAAPSVGMTRASVVVMEGSSPARTWFLGQEQVIGREPGAHGIRISDPAASRQHGRISWQGGGYVYQDLSPVNPTRVNGQPASGAVILKPGDRLTIGRTELVFYADTGSAGTA